MLIAPQDILEYTTGWTAAKGGAPFQPGLSWWWREGWKQGNAGRPQLALVINALPPSFSALEPLTSDEVMYYEEGHAGIRASADYWWRVGEWDRKNLRPLRPVRGPIPPVLIEGALTAGRRVAMILISPVDQAEFDIGWSLATTRQPFWGFSWWRREAFEEAAAGWPQVRPVVGQVPPPGRKLALLSIADVDGYRQGYAERPAAPAATSDFWYRWGAADALAGLPPQPLSVGQPPPDFPVGPVVTPPSPPLPYPPAPYPTPPGGVRYLELLATEFGRKIPYDLAVRIQTAPVGTNLLLQIPKLALRFELLGDGPGDQLRGFRLSGPGGPIARWVNYLVSRGLLDPNPNAYGLPAWIGARTMGRGTVGNIRLLGRRELEAVGEGGALDQLFLLP